MPETPTNPTDLGSPPCGAPAPLIGLSTYVERARWGVRHEDAALLPQAYVNAVIRAGGLPVLLPPAPTGPAAVLSALDGLVVTGGPDVDPALYGADPHAETKPARPERDAWELALCRGALEADLPLLAICRGAQILNASLGGTLHQHLPDTIGSDAHRPVEGQVTSTQIALDSGSTVAKILGSEAEGLCHHHQAIDRLGSRVQAVGFAPDGTIEAVEVLGQEFALGVQWHPEENPEDDRLVAALVEAAAAYRDDRQH